MLLDVIFQWTKEKIFLMCGYISVLESRNKTLKIDFHDKISLALPFVKIGNFLRYIMICNENCV